MCTFFKTVFKFVDHASCMTDIFIVLVVHDSYGCHYNIAFIIKPVCGYTRIIQIKTLQIVVYYCET